MKSEIPARNNNHLLTCALDIQRDVLVAALVDGRGTVIHLNQSPMPEAGGRAGVQAVIRSLLEIIVAPQRNEREINAVGICLPGNVDLASGRVSVPVLKWDRLALREQIERAVEASGMDIRYSGKVRQARAEKKQSSLPTISITSEAIAGAVAESWIGAAEDKKHIVFVHAGRTIECGLMADGRIIYGVGGFAGSAGWCALSEEFREEYARHGCLTTEAAAAALVRRALEEWTDGDASPLSQMLVSSPADLSASAVIRAARSGDALAVRVVSDVCQWLGRGIAELISLMNPEIVVVGGEMGLALRPYLNEVRREARLWAQPTAARQCRILSATLGKNSGLLGAARLAQMSEACA
jgi:glucokinase